MVDRGLDHIYALLKEQEDMVPIHAVADWLAGYAAPPNMRPTSVYNHEEILVLWMTFLKQFREGEK